MLPLPLLFLPSCCAQGGHPQALLCLAVQVQPHTPALPLQMEVEKPPPTAESPSLLKSYKWRMGPQGGEKELERALPTPGPSRWSKLHTWKRAYSHPETDTPEESTARSGQSPGPPGPTGSSRAAARRSMFQRAFSAPAKAPKEPRGQEGGKLNLRKYLRSMSHRRSPENGAKAERTPLEVARGEGGLVLAAHLGTGASGWERPSGPRGPEQQAWMKCWGWGSDTAPGHTFTLEAWAPHGQGSTRAGGPCSEGQTLG